MEAIASRVEVNASRVEAIASRVEAIATRLETIASGTSRVEAITSRVEAIATSNKKLRGSRLCRSWIFQVILQYAAFMHLDSLHRMCHANFLMLRDCPATPYQMRLHKGPDFKRMTNLFN